MNASDVRAYVKSVLTKSFTNKSTIDKLSTSDDGNLLFDGNEIKGGAGTILSKDIYYTPENYSEEEKVIGVYTDGRPIYRKTYKGDFSLVGDTNVHKLSDLNIDNINEIININSIAYLQNDTYYRNGSEEYFILVSLENKKIEGVSATGSHITYIIKSITIEYTKTTDLENSFNESMIVDEIQLSSTAVDMYNTEEKVCGRWINGKPIYKKTIGLSNLSPTTNTISHGISNYEQIIDISGYLIRSDGQKLTIPFVYSVSTSQISVFDANSTSISILVGSDFANLFNYANCGYLTLEYTKTSDEPNSFNSNMLENVTVNYAGDKVLRNEMVLYDGDLPASIESNSISSTSASVELLYSIENFDEVEIICSCYNGTNEYVCGNSKIIVNNIQYGKNMTNVLAMALPNIYSRAAFGFFDSTHVTRCWNSALNFPEFSHMKVVGISYAKNNYSTDEKIVGTWIDGKPIYRKTIDLTQDIKCGMIPHNIPNVKYAMINSNSFVQINNGYFIFPNFWYGNGAQITIQVDSTGFFINYASLDIIKAIITVDYTKTTDSATITI